jgi:hypothetical protein
MTLDDFYSGGDRKIKDEIDSLMGQWKSHVKNKPVYNHEGVQYYGKDCFCTDGFFPGYCGQRKKILFIGRDPVDGMKKKGWVETVFDEYQSGKTGTSPFHPRLLYLARGILEDFFLPGRYDSPSSSEIAKNIGKEGGISFAFMDFSKYVDDTTLSKDLVEKFIEHSNFRNTRFFKREIEILSPDIILTMNLWDMGIETETIQEVFEDDIEPVKVEWHTDNSTACLREMEIKSKKIPVIDLYHFSATNKGTEEHFYEPVKEIIRHPEFRKKYNWDKQQVTSD